MLVFVVVQKRTMILLLLCTFVRALSFEVSQLSAPPRVNELLALQGRELTSDDYDILLRLDGLHANRNKSRVVVETQIFEDVDSIQTLSDKLLGLVEQLTAENDSCSIESNGHGHSAAAEEARCCVCIINQKEGASSKILTSSYVRLRCGHRFHAGCCSYIFETAQFQQKGCPCPKCGAASFPGLMDAPLVQAASAGSDDNKHSKQSVRGRCCL